RDGGLQVGTLGGQTQGAAAAHGVAHDRQSAAVDPAAHRGGRPVDHVVQRGVELLCPAVRLVEGGVGVDGDDDEAVGGDALAQPGNGSLSAGVAGGDRHRTVGVVLPRVVDGAAAEAAGAQPGDVLLADGEGA